VWNDFLSECLKAVGMFFLHPLLYVFFLTSLVIGYIRVKKERKNFSFRIYNTTYELKTSIWNGLLLGFAFSIITLGIGIMVPVELLYVIGLITILVMLTLQVQWMSGAYLVGISLFLVTLVPASVLPNQIQDLVEYAKAIHFQSITILVGLLLLIEGILIQLNASKKSNPLLVESKRGRKIGAHSVKRLWLVPLFLLIPTGPITSDISWWPVLHIGHTSYSIVLVPFSIGFYQVVRGSIANETVKMIGRQICLLSILVIAGGALSFYSNIIAYATLAIAIVGRELITYLQRNRDENSPSIFTSRERGLVVLGILSGSPAEKMDVHVGETITKVNGQIIKSITEFYEALQINRAYCKLEVIDLNAQIRITQGAVYEGQHHELGFLFVEDAKELIGKIPG
jgi:cytochrome b561